MGTANCADKTSQYSNGIGSYPRQRRVQTDGEDRRRDDIIRPVLATCTRRLLCEHTAQQQKRKKNQPTSFAIGVPHPSSGGGAKGEKGSMAEHKEEHVPESVMDKISEKFHGGDSSSSSDSDDEKKGSSSASAAEAMKAKIYRLFGRERPVHSVLGGGKPADLVLWRNKKISGGVLAGATAIWLLFEVMEYHLLTLVCHCLILSLAILFLWSNASTFINKSPPNIPEVKLPEDLAVNVALSLRYEINRGFATLREIGHGRDLKKFLILVAGLWLLSILGSCCNFLTLFYIVFVVLYTVPVLYEKYEDKVDAFGEKAMIEMKKYYAIFDEKCLSKIPKGPLKDKKH